MGLGRRNPHKKRGALFPEGEGGAHRCPEDKVSAAGVLARSSGFTTNLNACFKSLGRLNCNIGFFFSSGFLSTTSFNYNHSSAGMS